MRMLALALVVLSLSACGSSPEVTQAVLPTVAQFPTPTDTASPTSTETATQTLTPTMTVTETQTAALTAIPTDTIAPTVPPTQTSVPNSPTPTPEISFGVEGDIIADWLTLQDGVDVVEWVSLDRPDDMSPLLYIELIVFPGYNTRDIPEGLLQFVSEQFDIDEFASFGVIISDGITATDYFFGFGEWTITELTMVTPPTPSSFSCNCNFIESLECSNFSSQSEAQSCFDQCSGLANMSNLDSDADGEACEFLP